MISESFMGNFTILSILSFHLHPELGCCEQLYLHIIHIENIDLITCSAKMEYYWL